MKILFFGDIVGRTGRQAIASVLPRLRERYAPDLVIANAENAAHGSGISQRTATALFDAGCDILTGGNHIFDKKDQSEEAFRNFPEKIVRPANFSDSYPGKGWVSTSVKKKEVVIANFNAQVFMERQFRGEIASPFQSFDKLLHDWPKSAIIIVDFHSEATSEKRGFGLHADGRAAAVLGTHTHVQTADAQVLPGGTAYISDVGMVGAANSILGVEPAGPLARFMGDEKAKFEIMETKEAEVGYVIIEVNDDTLKATSIESRLERVSLS